MQQNPPASASRRDLLRTGAGLGLGGLFVGLAACQSQTKAACSDPAKLTDEQIAVRTSFSYVEKSPQPAQACVGCAFFHGEAAAACGTCELLKGPVNPAGHCTSWSARKT